MRLYFILSNELLKISVKSKGRSRTAATSKLEHFVMVVNSFQPLTIIKKGSIFVVAAVLDPSLKTTTFVNETLKPKATF